MTWNKSFVEDRTGYCYNVGYGQKYDGNIFENYGIECKKHDIVSMYFDADNCVLRFSVNDEDQGIAYYVENKRYRAAVGTAHPGESVEFIHYKQY